MAYLLYGPAAIAVTAYVTTVAHSELDRPWWVAYLVAINGVAFLFYVYDKVIARLLGALGLGFLPLRVPEDVLVWGLAFPGGIVGAYAGMYLADHKTGPGTQDFRVNLAKALLAQLVLGFVLFRWAGVPLAEVDSAVERLAGTVLNATQIVLATVGSL